LGGTVKPLRVSLVEPVAYLKSELTDELRRFLVERYGNPKRPPVATPDSRDPNPSDERKAAIKLYMDYEQATIDNVHDTNAKSFRLNTAHTDGFGRLRAPGSDTAFPFGFSSTAGKMRGAQSEKGTFAFAYTCTVC
jgi:hypothetical protein